MTVVTTRMARLELARRAAHRSLAAYVRAMWPIMNPNTDIAWGATQDAICEHVQAWVLGQIRFLLVEVPPGSSKSTIASRCAPCWSWQSSLEGLSPSMRWMCGSYNAELSNRLNADRRQLITSPVARAFMGTPVTLATGEKNKTYFRNPANGYMMAVTPASAATGFHCDRQVLDDLVKPDDAIHDSAALSKVHGWMESTIPTRFGDLTKQAVALINQRLGKGDPSDKFMEMYPDAVRLTIPAEYDPARSTVTVLPNGKGFKDWRTEPGQSFEPIRFPSHVLEQKRHELKANYHAQFQQHPVKQGGSLIKVGAFQRYETIPDLTGAKVIISADTAFTDSKRADDTAIQVWAATKEMEGQPAGLYLLDQEFGQLSFVEMIDAIKRLGTRWPMIRQRLIEAGGKGSGDAIVSMLRQQGVIVKPISYKRGGNNATSKKARVSAWTPLLEGRLIYLPHKRLAPWVDGFIAECEAFPLIPEDGQVDAATIALLHLGRRFGLQMNMLVDLDEHREAERPRRKRRNGGYQYRT